MTVNGHFLADRYSVSLRTIQNWANAGAITRIEKDCYDLAASDLYFINKLRSEIEKLRANPENAGDENPTYRKLLAEARLTEAKADIAELERDKLKGSLILLEDAIKDFSNLVLKVRAKFLAIPARLSLELSGMVEPRAIAALLQTTIDEALNELSEE